MHTIATAVKGPEVAAALHASTPLVPAFVRASGRILASFQRGGGPTFPSAIHEEGGLRLRFPRSRNECEAVLINTAGGMAGGDCARLSLVAGPDAEACLTTQSAEKIYRTQGPTSALDFRLRLESGARFDLLPQETILFDGAHLTRRLEVDMAEDASLTMLDATVFGRLAMGEVRPRGMLREHRRIRRAGRLIHAEDLRLEGDLATILDRPACGAGARMLATLVHIAPDAEARLDELRPLLGGGAALRTARSRRGGHGTYGASAWNGMLVVRFAAQAPSEMRPIMLHVVEQLRRRPLPRVWQ